MDELNRIVEKYLDANGIKMNFFAECIGCGYTHCSRWFKGERKLTSEQLRKTHDFLAGKYIRTVEQVIQGEH